ncbi:class I SAM-dependent methyltransferase [Geminicoccaceae bacterium 1502E]|nr:class I SAM-dependent methyltransferase [Geminicoccaceae bacterium 1502E]
MFSELRDDIDNYALAPDMFLAVPFVPSEEDVVEAMLTLAGVGSKDVLYDLGSGDGRIVIAAARDRGTRCVGIEIDPLRIADAMEQAGWAGVECLVDFVEDDIFAADFSEATVVTLYLLESVNVDLRPRLLAQLRPGARIVSHAFAMGDWKADDALRLSGTTVYKWIVPARVAGAWEWERQDGRQYRVELQQKFQAVTGNAWLAGQPACLKSAMLCGSRLKVELQENDTAPIDSFALAFANNRLQTVTARSQTIRV